MCGPSSQQLQLAGQQQNFYQTLQSGYQQAFAGQTSLLNSLQASFQPILAAGINQYGFSPQENAALRTQATTGTASQYQAANQATQEELASVGGGNQALPSGAAAELTQQNALAAAQQESTEQLGITQAGYQQGQANYMAAANALGGVAQAWNPEGYAGLTTGAGSAAFGEQTQNANQSSTMWAGVGGAAAGAAGAALCPAIGSLYLMADGADKPVEKLVVGDLLQGVDGKTQTIDEIQSAVLPILRVVIANGCVLRNSITHCYVLADGGWTLAVHALDKVVMTHDGPSKVIRVEHDGKDTVFNVLTDGSHTYQADGVWAYGVGHAASDLECAEYLKDNE
jgi:hypothetical protein